MLIVEGGENQKKIVEPYSEEIGNGKEKSSLTQKRQTHSTVKAIPIRRIIAASEKTPRSS